MHHEYVPMILNKHLILVIVTMILEILDLLQILFNNSHFQFWVKMGPVVTVTIVAGNIYCPTLRYLGAHNLFHFSNAVISWSSLPILGSKT